jgi:hypothetical protein
VALFEDLLGCLEIVFRCSQTKVSVQMDQGKIYALLLELTKSMSISAKAAKRCIRRSFHVFGEANPFVVLVVTICLRALRMKEEREPIVLEGPTEAAVAQNRIEVLTESIREACKLPAWEGEIDKAQKLYRSIKVKRPDGIASREAL